MENLSDCEAFVFQDVVNADYKRLQEEIQQNASFTCRWVMKQEMKEIILVGEFTQYIKLMEVSRAKSKKKIS